MAESQADKRSAHDPRPAASPEIPLISGFSDAMAAS